MSGLLFFIYLLVVLAALFYLGLWLMRYTTRLGYAPEKRIIFTVVLLACLAFIAYMIGSTLRGKPEDSQPETSPAIQPSALQKPTPKQQPEMPEASLPIGQQEVAVPEARPQTEEEKLLQFEKDNYPGLYEQRLALAGEITDLEAFFKSIKNLSGSTPKQLTLLQKILNIRYDGYQKLQRRNLGVSQDLREFWVHYSTGNSHDTIRKFTPLASRLVRQIKVTQGEVLDNKRKEEKVLTEHMRRAGQYLKSSKVPAELAGKIKSYHSQNRTMMMDWLAERGNHQTTLRVLNDLWGQRILITDRIKRVQDFKERYPDLRAKLNRTLALWYKALEGNYYADFRLLYAAESMFVVDYLELRTGEIPAKRLDKELRDYSEKVGKQADVLLGKAEQGYQPPGM